MNISKESSMGKLFFWALGICEKFTDRSLEYKFRNQTNLCHFVRTVFVYTPIILLLQLLFWVGAVTCLIVVPAYMFGFAGFLKTTGLVLAGIVLVILLLFLIFLIGEGYSRTRNWISDFKHGRKRAPTPLSITVDWVKAKKQKICPIIRFS